MRILGLVGSRRKLGNSEMLVKKTLLHCRDKGASIELCRLTSLNIRPCRGCIQCMLAQSECSLGDDMRFLLEQIGNADGLVLGFPTYVHNIPGTLKLIQDRVYMLGARMHQIDKFKGKRALAIACGSLEKMELALAFGELFLKTFLLRPVGALFFAGSSGSGASILNNGAKVSLLEKKAEALLKPAWRNPPPEEPGCSFCRRKIVQVLENGEVECPLCNRRGRLVSANIHWQSHGDAFEAEDTIRSHKDRVTADYRAYYSKRSEIVDIMQPFKEKNCQIGWVTPCGHPTKPHSCIKGRQRV